MASTLRPTCSAAGEDGHAHLVEFYETEEFLVETVSGFIGPSLHAGDAALIVATAAHRAAFDDAIRSSGVDLGTAVSSGRYLSVDAAELLSTFMVGGTPDGRRFADTIGAVIERAGAGGRRVRIYGEMVALLWDAGAVSSAIALEDLWNDLSASYEFALLCAYPMSAFEAKESAAGFRRICEQHTTVIPSEGFSMQADPGEQRRAVARLQQEMTMLRADVTGVRVRRSRVFRDRDRRAGRPDATSVGVLRREMARALAALFGAGGTLALVSLLFPRWSGLHGLGVAAPAVVAEFTCLLLLIAGERLPIWSFHPVLAMGTCCIGAAVYFGGGSEHSIYSPYYIWVALYAFYFFTARQAWCHLGLASVTNLALLLVTGSTAAGPTWLVTTGTAAVTGLVITLLVTRLRGLASTDPLTGLANRRTWDDALDREVAKAHRRGTTLCVAVLDLDGLKQLNDEYGHHAGDDAISDAATSWLALVRRGDLLARLGGDEFGLMLHDCGPGDAIALLQRVHAALSGVSVSSGLACLEPEETAAALVARADDALYDAKRGGRNQAVSAI